MIRGGLQLFERFPLLGIIHRFHADEHKASNTRRSMLIAAASALIIYLMFSSVLLITAVPEARADELSDTKSELDLQLARLDELTAKVDSLQSEIDGKAASAMDLEDDINKKRELVGEMTVFFYKNPTASLVEYLLSSEDMGQMVARAELLFDYTDDIARQAAQEQRMCDELQAEIDSVSAQKDEQATALEELESIVTELEAKKERLEEEQRVKLTAGQTFTTDFSSGEWRTCTASAYGGYGDASIADNQCTATGAAVTESSMGVAVPMGMSGYRSLFGKKVEISYNGKSVIATVNDCGGMHGGGPGGERELDLQPGVFKALGGADNCNEWGLRAVKWRVL